MSDYYNTTATFQENAIALSQGNPGAATVLGKLSEHSITKADEVMQALDKMNLFGPRIWLAYKDYAEKDLDVFITAVLSSDPELIELVNDMRIDGPPVRHR